MSNREVIAKKDSRKQRTVSSSYCREGIYGPTMQKEKWKESS
jgi:hypothetical protein